jgi:hypothetical protein
MLNWSNDMLQQQYLSGVVQLPLAMFATFFAFLFVLVRWWRQSEWTRPTRVSLWNMAWCGAVAGVVSLFWWFPQPLGVICAAVISFTVQLSSPWLAPRRRKQLAQAAA